jgi:hypothetical protein
MESIVDARTREIPNPLEPRLAVKFDPGSFLLSSSALRKKNNLFVTIGPLTVNPDW